MEPDLTKNSNDATPSSMSSPVSVTSDGVRLYVADLGHNRVLIWNSIPVANATATFMLTVRRCPLSVTLRPSPTVPAHYITGGIVIGNNNDEQKSAPLWQPAVAGFFND